MSESESAPYAPPAAPLVGGADSARRVPPAVLDELERAKNWAWFLAVVLLLAALGMAVHLVGWYPRLEAGSMLGFGFETGASLVAAFLGFSLWRFASGVKQVLALRTELELARTLGHQAAFWATCGVVGLLTFVALVALLATGLVRIVSGIAS